MKFQYQSQPGDFGFNVATFVINNPPIVYFRLIVRCYRIYLTFGLVYFPFYIEVFIIQAKRIISSSKEEEASWSNYLWK